MTFLVNDCRQPSFVVEVAGRCHIEWSLPFTVHDVHIGTKGKKELDRINVPFLWKIERMIKLHSNTWC